MDAQSNKKVALLVTTLGAFLTPFMGSSINVALPLIGKEFVMDALLLSWVSASFLLSAAIFLVPFGKIADIWGRKKIFTLGIFIFTVSSLLGAISKTSLSFIFFRILQGIGGAMIFATLVAILTSVFPRGERGKALGINAVSVYLGLSLGPFLGGVLCQHFGWRSIFLLNVPLGFLIIVLTLLKLKGEWAEAKGEKFDLAGSVLYGFSLFSLMYGFSRLPTIFGFSFVLIGILGILGFVKLETKVKNPILNVDLFKKNKVFAFSNLSAFINYSVTFAVPFLLSLYLQYLKGLSPQNTGLVLLSQPIIMTIFSPLAGRISDRIDPQKLASAGMSLTTAALFLFTFLKEKTSLGFVIANLILIGLGLAFFVSPNANAIMGSVEKKFYGVASGTLATMRLLGQMLSMGMTMVIFAIFMGKVQITPQSYSLFLTSTKITFTIFAILCFFGIFTSLARDKLR